MREQQKDEVAPIKGLFEDIYGKTVIFKSQNPVTMAVISAMRPSQPV